MLSRCFYRNILLSLTPWKRIETDVSDCSPSRVRNISFKSIHRTERLPYYRYLFQTVALKMAWHQQCSAVFVLMGKMLRLGKNCIGIAHHLPISVLRGGGPTKSDTGQAGGFPWLDYMFIVCF